MKLERGETIVCPFRRVISHDQDGKQDIQWASRGPGNVLVRIKRGLPEPQEEERPYVCTIRGTRPRKDDATKVGALFVSIDRPVEEDDYDVLLSADVERGTLLKELRYATHFQHLKRKEFTARIEERGTTVGDPKLVVKLSHGRHEHTSILGRGEALRRGCRIGHLTSNPGGTPPEPRILPPKPEPVDRAWIPTAADHTHHLILPAGDLLHAFRKTQQDLGTQALAQLLRRRLVAILTFAAYDEVPLRGAGHVDLEHALTFLQRHACHQVGGEAVHRLALAESRRLILKLPHQPDDDLVAYLRAHDVAAEAGHASILVPVQAFLRLTTATDGAWNLSNHRVEQGRVHLTKEQACRLLANAAQKQHTTPPPLDAAAATVVQPAIAGLTDPTQPQRSPKPNRTPLPLESFPPCVRRILHKSVREGLTTTEVLTAASFLHHAGYAAPRSLQSLIGHAAARNGAYEIPGASGSLRSGLFQPPPCQTAKELGLCSWNCGTTMQQALEVPA